MEYFFVDDLAKPAKCNNDLSGSSRPATLCHTDAGQARKLQAQRWCLASASSWLTKILDKAISAIHQIAAHILDTAYTSVHMRRMYCAEFVTLSFRTLFGLTRRCGEFAGLR